MVCHVGGEDAAEDDFAEKGPVSQRPVLEEGPEGFTRKDAEKDRRVILFEDRCVVVENA